MRTFIFAFTVLFLASACNNKIGKTESTTGSEPAASASKKAGKVMRQLEDNSFTTEFMEGRAKIKVESESFNIGGTAVIRIEKDKAIWMSMKKFGFEGARALIRPDSFFVVNRLNGDYTAEPLSYIEEKYKIPARFDLLQEMVLGNPVFLSRDLELTREENFRVLTGRDAQFATEYLVEMEKPRLLETTLKELAQNRELKITNMDFRPVAGLTGQPEFPHRRTITIDAGKQSGRFEMEYTRLSFEGPLDMPFRRR